MALFNYCNKYINRDSYPDLSLHGVRAGTVKDLDPEVLLDPLKEQFNLPAGLIEQADGERGQIEVVGQEADVTILFRIVIVNAAERVRVVFPCGNRTEHDGLIGSNSAGCIDDMRVPAPQRDSFLGASYKEGACNMKDVESLEIHVATIHHVERIRFRHDAIEDLDVGHFSIGNRSEEHT